jgi:hypothetical protein
LTVPVNSGFIQMSNELVTILIYYDATAPIGSQPLIDGPRGFCLDMTNLSGHNARITLTLPDGTLAPVTVGQGDPVTGGPASGRSRTAAQVNALGFTLRTDIKGLLLNPVDAP